MEVEVKYLEQLIDYIDAQYAILVAVLYCLGTVLKSIKIFPNQFIPITLTVLGISLACLSAASRSAEYTNLAALIFDGVAQGILCTGMAVYVNEVLVHCGHNNTCSTGKISEKGKRDG